MQSNNSILKSEKQIFESLTTLVQEKYDVIPYSTTQLRMSQGGCGIIFVGKRKVDGVDVVFKVGDMSIKSEHVVISKFFAERQIAFETFKLPLVVKGKTFFVLILKRFQMDLNHMPPEVFKTQYKKLLRQCLEQLKIMHKANYVHRDISPGNIMIDENGDATILDFGLTQQMQGSEDMNNGIEDKDIGVPMFMGLHFATTGHYCFKDDIEALAYTFLYVYNGRQNGIQLPWTDKGITSKKDILSTDIPIPQELKDLIQASRNTTGNNKVDIGKLINVI